MMQATNNRKVSPAILSVSPTVLPAHGDNGPAPSLLGPVMDRRADRIQQLRKTTIAQATPGPARWRNLGGQTRLFADYGARQCLLDADARNVARYADIDPVAFLRCNVEGRLESLENSVVQTDRHPDLVLISTAFDPAVGLLACWEMLVAGREELREEQADSAWLRSENDRLRDELRTIAFQSSVNRPPSERLPLIAEAARRALGELGQGEQGEQNAQEGEGEDAQ